MKSRIRTFIAIDISPMVLGSLDNELPKLTAAAPEFKWVQTNNMHITLSFLGDVPDRDIPEVCGAVEKAVSTIEEFELEIVGLGAFPRNDRPRVVWAGVRNGRDEVCQLQAAVGQAVQQLGFLSDREIYVPHLTLGRAGRSATFTQELVDLIAETQDKQFGVCSVDEVVVYASYPERTGPVYVPMASLSLTYQ